MKLLLVLLCLSLVLAVSGKKADLRVRISINWDKKRGLEQQMQNQFPDLADDLLGADEERRDLSQLTAQQKLKLSTGIGQSIGKYLEGQQDLLGEQPAL